jgi:hypothetical protein
MGFKMKGFNFVSYAMGQELHAGKVTTTRKAMHAG